jgi:hypothetical protein
MNLNNEGQEWKTDHTKGKTLVGEGSKEGEYGGCTFYTRMNIEYLNLLKLP